MNSSYFTEEHELFRQSLKDFLQKEVVPHIEKWEKTGTIERFIWKKFGEMGFFGIAYPEAYGGMNLDLFYTVVFLEELQKIKSSGFAAAIWAHAYLAMTHLNAEGDERIKQEYLVPSISGDQIGALCITEPFGGSDVAGMRTTAIKKGNKYILNGSKTFITNGVYADYYVVAAKTSPELGNKGISIFLMDTNLNGVSATKLDKLGWRASDTAEIAFDNVEIPEENLMGEEGKGWTPYFATLFFWIFFINIWSIIPGIQFPATARIAIPLILALLSWATFIGVGLIRQGPAYFWNSINPPGVPIAFKFLVVPIEFFSKFLMRPFSLAVRLFANMTAGHLILTIFAIMTNELLIVHNSGLYQVIFAPLPFLGLVAFTGFEVLVAVLQAYIFTILTAVYVSESMHAEH